MGLGKTPIAIAFAELAGGLCVIIVPPYLKTYWLDEIEKFSNKIIYIKYIFIPATYLFYTKKNKKVKRKKKTLLFLKGGLNFIS